MTDARRREPQATSARRLPGEKTVAPDATDLGHGALGTPVFLAHPEDDGVDETKGMIEHQAFDFAIGRSAPMAAHEKRPANLDLAEFGFIAVIAARADQPAGRAVDEYEGHFRGDRAVEIRTEFRLGVAVGAGMHLPDFRIGAGREQLRPVVSRDRSHDDGGARQRWLEIRHRRSPARGNLRYLPAGVFQSLNGSNSFSPAIATANGRNVCSTLIEPECSARTSCKRR